MKYLSEFHNADEMALRIHEAFNLFDCNKDGVIDFLEVKVGLERLKLYPKVELLEEDWRDITNHGQLCGDNYTLNYHQFFEVMRNQVTLYVQRVASKAFAWEQKINKGSDEHSTTFVLKYLVTAIDDLRSTMISMQKLPSTPSVYRGQGRGRGRQGIFPRCVKHKRRTGLMDESTSYQATSRTPSVGETTTREEFRSLNSPFLKHNSFESLTSLFNALAPIMAEAQEVFFGADEGRSDVEDYAGIAAGPHAGTHMERERDREQDHQQGTISDPSISPAPEFVCMLCKSISQEKLAVSTELMCKQPEVNSTCEPNTALTNLKTGQSQRPRYQMHYSKRAVPDMPDMASESTLMPFPHEPQVAAPLRNHPAALQSRTPDAPEHIKERIHSKVYVIFIAFSSSAVVL